MTWNCRGVASAAKLAQITAYRTARAINNVFLQEGGSEHDSVNTAGARISSFDEKHGGDFSTVSNNFLFGNTTRTEKVLTAAFGRQDFTGIGADGSNKKYTLISPAADPVPAPATPDYATDADIRTFIMAPAEQWVAATPEPAVTTGVKRKRADSLSVKDTRGKLQLVVDGDLTIDTAKKQTHVPTAARVSLLARRRPRMVVMPINGVNYDVYFWHASLGSAMTLEGTNLTPAYTPCKNHASGGDLALIVSIFFAKYLGINGAFPAQTLIMGDLNIDSVAVQAIYQTTNILSSLDGWCHVIAPMGVPLTQRFANEFTAALPDYRCNQPGYGLMVSDHAPIVFDI
jgi:hypothetical protein